MSDPDDSCLELRGSSQIEINGKLDFAESHRFFGREVKIVGIYALRGIGANQPWLPANLPQARGSRLRRDVPLGSGKHFIADHELAHTGGVQQRGIEMHMQVPLGMIAPVSGPLIILGLLAYFCQE